MRVIGWRDAVSHFRNVICHALGLQLKVWLLRKLPSPLGMQFKMPCLQKVMYTCKHVRKFIILSAVAAQAVSLLR